MLHDAAREIKAANIMMENIQAKVIENRTQNVVNKLNEIQAITTRLENKYEAIEHTVKEAPKTYIEIIQSAATNAQGKAIAEMRARRKREILRQERAKYEVTLTTKDASNEVKESIDIMPPEKSRYDANRPLKKPPSLMLNYKE